MPHAQFGFGPDCLDFLQGLNISHENANREFPQLPVTAYPSTFPTRQGEQSPQAGVSAQKWKEEKLERGMMLVNYLITLEWCWSVTRSTRQVQ